MNKTAWTVVIVIVVLIILYLVYKYMFQNKVETKIIDIPTNVVIPRVHPIPSGIINTEQVNPNINTDYTNTQSSLMTILKLLGYDVVTDANGNVTATGTWQNKALMTKFGLRFTGTTNISGVLVDLPKWNAYETAGLANSIVYNNKDNPKANDYYNKLVDFWGKDFFNLTAQKIMEAAKNAVPVVDCNSKEYKDKLLRLYTNLKQAGNKYQISVFNINNVNNSENTQALTMADKALGIADDEYKKHLNLCKTS